MAYLRQFPNVIMTQHMAFYTEQAVVSMVHCGLESLMADGAYNGAERVSDQSSFKFSIASATSDGSTAITDYSALPDGYWTGDVKVQFNATWTTPA